MKKFLKKVLVGVGVGVLFGLFIVLGVIGMQMEEKSPTVRSDTPESIPVQAKENMAVVAAESGKKKLRAIIDV